MAKRPRILRAERKIIGQFDLVNPNAAGIDAGAEHHLVSVPEDRASEPVQTFGTFTCELHRLADWLVACGITTVAIEATGVYWIPLFEILEERGLRPKLVDSRSIGRRNKKTDVLDCQWIRQLHMFGLLDAGFRPPADIMVLRALTRQRMMLISYAADHVRHIQKALDLMNVKLHLAVSDTVGVTGLRIIHAILRGEHEPSALSALREPGCKASEETFVKALTGNYRAEHLFALRQAVDLFEVYQSKIRECDDRIAETLTTFDKRGDLANVPTRKRRKRRKNQPHFDGQRLLYEIAGVDLVKVDGLDSSTILTILSETGTDMSPWNTGKRFCSWLTLDPKNRTSGTTFQKKGAKPRPNRAAQAFRLAAVTLERAQCALGAFFRRIKIRHGRQLAIKATARKLAVIFYSMLKNKTEYHDPGVSYYEQRYRDNLLNSLKKKAAMLGFELTPAVMVH